MSSSSKSAKITTLCKTDGSAEADLVTFPEGDLGQIQNILLGGPAREIERRIQALESSFSTQLGAVEKRLSGQLDQLVRSDAAKVSHSTLSGLLMELARELSENK